MDEPAPDAPPRSAWRWLVGPAKLLLAVGIIAALVYRLRGDGVFNRLVDEPKHWGYLALAQVLVLTALSLSYFRWYLLVRALGLDFTLPDALRLGSLGFMLSQVSPGSVGGDLFKALFVAREQPGRRTEAVATVVIDRVVGLYAMLLVASCGRFLAGGGATPPGVIRAFVVVIAVFTVVGTVGIGLLMTPFFTGPWVRGQLGRLPVVGGTVARLVDAAAAYRNEKRYLFAAIGVACCTHTLFVVAFWLISRGLPVAAPSLPTMFIVGPLSMCAGAVPLTPSGLGVAEAAMGELFRAFGYPRSDGLLVALCHRAMTYVMAALGAVYYISARRTVKQVLHEAEELAEAPH